MNQPIRVLRDNMCVNRFKVESINTLLNLFKHFYRLDHEKPLFFMK